MDGFSKVLKSVFWATFLFAPLFYFGYKAMPMIKDTVDYTKKIGAQNDARRHERLEALTEATELQEDASDLAQELDPAADPNLISENEGSKAGSNEAKQTRKPASALGAGARSDIGSHSDAASGSGAAETEPGVGSDSGSGRSAVKSKSHKPVIEITNANMNEYWDPAAEERINGMAISSELKRQILENYHRTGNLPEAVATNRGPASEK